jgi:hypothetical protein
MMAMIARVTAGYLNMQVDAGADVVQLFDSWVGSLGPDDYRRFVLPHTASIISAIKPGVPVIHFGTVTGNLLELMREAGGDVIGLDWRVDLAQAWARKAISIRLRCSRTFLRSAVARRPSSIKPPAVPVTSLISVTESFPTRRSIMQWL